MRVLVCEDDVMTLKAIEHKLHLENIETISANNGKDAMEIISSRDDIDLLLTDLHMPQANGLDIIKHVRNELQKNIPIIMLTREGIEDTVLKAFELGADEYITKPFSPEELLLRIKKLLIKLKLNV